MLKPKIRGLGNFPKVVWAENLKLIVDGAIAFNAARTVIGFRTFIFFALYRVWGNGTVDSSDSHPPLTHHFFQLAITQRVAEIPPNALQDDIGLEVTPFCWDWG